VTSGKVATTIGYERRNNAALTFTDRAAFLRFMTADQPVRPANIANIVAINQGARPLTMGEPEAPWVAPGEVAARVSDGAMVVDARSSAAFGAGHVPGAINIQITTPEFEQRVGWVTPLDVPLVLVLAEEGLQRRALRALAFLGLDARVQGILAGGMDAWVAEGRPVATVPQIAAPDLQAQLAAGTGPHVLDVREPAEWSAGHVEGAHLQSYRQLQQRLADLPFARDEPVAVICHSGARSSTAASLLRHHGFTNVSNVTGGMVAWREAGLPVV
jgi:hydroxyacylglutathione hydrolase